MAEDTCSVVTDGKRCPNPIHAKARGWCEMHYHRWIRHGSTDRLIEDHGLTLTPEYRSWVRMRRRCFDQNDVGYANYGGRGITVCAEWAVSFSAFLAAMGPIPEKGMTLDRIDTNGDYEPGNCRWTTNHVQARNKRTNVWLTLNGRTQVMADWSKELNIPLTTILERRRRGLSDEDCLDSDYIRGRGQWRENTQRRKRKGL